MRIHALIFFLFFAASGGQSAFALYGARPATSTAHLVKLQVNQEVFCQAVVIAPTKFLTAGHCIQQLGLHYREESLLLTYYPEVVSVVSGKESRQAFSITFAPTMFDSPNVLSEDLALVEISSPLKGVEVLPFAPRADLVPGAAVLLTSYDQEAPVRILKKASGTQSLVLMTDGSKSGICQGDSGGALLLLKNGKKYLAGVLSARAAGCAKRNSISYFPRRRFLSQNSFENIF